MSRLRCASSTPLLLGLALEMHEMHTGKDQEARNNALARRHPLAYRNVVVRRSFPPFPTT
jgi:hypothetical protein